MKIRFLLPALLAFAQIAPGQKTATPQSPSAPPLMDQFTRDELHGILNHAHQEVEKNYYDPKFHGVDMAALYRQYDTRINAAQSLNQGFALVASYLNSLHDSHTYFNPPARTDNSQTGFRYQMIGDHCLITHVQPGTDAAARLHPGDEVLTYDSFKMERATYTNMQYYFDVLATTKASGLNLLAPDGTRRHEVVQHRMVQNRRYIDLGADTGGMQRQTLLIKGEHWREIMKPRFLDAGDVIVWRQKEFDLSTEDVDTVFSKIGKHPALVIDLRGNPGGSVETLTAMVGHLFDHPVMIATLETRKPEKPVIAKPRGHTYGGKVIVLVDSDSASCAELFARIIQLEHRGTVLGDHTLGLVMEARDYRQSVGTEVGAGYSFSITYANLHMTDGQSLENHGVVPDELLLPTAQDLADGKDPVLKRAVEEAGGTYDAKSAAKAFPYLWPPSDEN